MNEQFEPPAPLQTSVLFLVFNRPETTAQVFEAIRQAKPPRLYIAADGPRADQPDEAEKVAKVREIATSVDWPCEVKTLFRDKNLGCMIAVSGAISWFFENEEQGIILEDDCLPSQSFFWFCEELLEKYKDDDNIFLISGYNKQNEWRSKECDYFFSNFGGIWGWASWRRAWAFYNGNMNELENLVDKNIFYKQMGKKLGRLRQRQLISAKEQMKLKKINSWAYPWALTRHMRDGKACVPSLSLIENIGFEGTGTHTNKKTSNVVTRHEIRFPICNNSSIFPDIKYDILFIKHRTLISRIKKKISMMLEYLFK